ncbi:MAG: hypothetical protein V4639_04595 [Pseudomonadota bacterium]
MNDDAKLVELLKTIANEYWRPDSPIYLSNVPRILAKSLPDFRKILGERTLKSFTKATEAEGAYRVIEHPTQREKIVLIPVDKDFQFAVDDGASSAGSVESGDRSFKTRAKTLDFLACLAHLTEQEKAQVVIPTAILVKLLQR